MEQSHMSNEKDAERPLRILHLEDLSQDAEIIRERLIDAGFFVQIDWAANEPQFKAFLQSSQYDLVLADYRLPSFDAPAALRLAQSLCPELPFICVSGAIGGEEVVELLKQGATDYVLKDKLGKLPLAIQRALDEVTERAARKQAEEAVLASLAEKEVLLREIHHRVKNNFAVICGLIRLQSRTITDPEVVVALKGLESRIRTMSMIHEKLCQTGNLSRIDFHDYLNTLISSIRESFSSRSDITFLTEADGIEMVIDDAMPCGLVLNELITNAVKYAFPATDSRADGNIRKICVTVQCEGTTYTVTVADNGVGLPAAMEWTTSKTLGLYLVRSLAEHQLGGQIHLDRTDGTRFVLKFNSKYKK
jgi:two-component sensor histidine kinase